MEYIAQLLPQLIGRDVGPIANRIKFIQGLQYEVMRITSGATAARFVIVVFSEVDLKIDRNASSSVSQNGKLEIL